jgi:hypothetical protein
VGVKVVPPLPPVPGVASLIVNELPTTLPEVMPIADALQELIAELRLLAKFAVLGSVI